MGLLLLTLLAPAGWVVAGEFTAPYVVLFDPAAVSVPDTTTDFTSDAVHSFRDLAAPPTLRAAIAAASPAVSSGGRTRVDSNRVASHVRAVAGRSRVRVNSVYAHAVGGFAADLTPGQLAAISADPSVEAVIPDLAVSIDDGSVVSEQSIMRNVANPSWQVPAGVRRVGARTSAITTFTHRTTRVDADVAILDTGVERDHPDLNVVGGYNCTGRNRNAWDDNDGHGTHVAGIVGALDNNYGVVGVAPGVRLWSVKVLDGHGRGFVSSLVCGIDWVTAQRDPRNPGRPLIEVANMSISFGVGHSPDSTCANGEDVIHQALCRSIAKGTTYVVAAGNNSHNARRNRPAAYDEVITVSAMADYDGRSGGHGKPSDSCPTRYEPDDSFTDFSNYGPDVDLIAPGRCVLSTYMGKRYAFMSGTSMATPHVTGAAAIYRAMYPRATPAQVRLGLEVAGTLDWRTNTDPDHNPERALWVGDFRRPPDFALNASAAEAVAPGGTLSITVRLSRQGGFDRPVSVALADPPAGFSAAPVEITGRSVVVRVDVAPRTRAGTYELTLVARGLDIEHRLSLDVAVRRRGAGGTVSDTTPPRAPSVSLAAALPSIDVRGFAVSGASVGASGTLWLSDAVTGGVELAVASSDPDSDVIGYDATLDADGWQAEWLGDPSEGRLLTSYDHGAAPAALLVTAINGDGLESDATISVLTLDSTPPAPVAWLAPQPSTTTRARTATATLSWSGGADDESGAADVVLARRYRAPLDSKGHFRTSAFAADGGYRLLENGTVDTALAPGYCYVWAARALDNVGNAGAAAVSGYVVVRA